MAAGYVSQQALVHALAERGLSIDVRQVRRWESDTPPWPYPGAQQALTELLGQDVESLGFTPPAGHDRAVTSRVARVASPGSSPRVSMQNAASTQPASAAADYLAVTRAHRRLYWTVAPAVLHPAVSAHAALGGALLPATAGATRQAVATALAESFLLAGRIEFFDLREPQQADDTWLRALQAAGEADDPLLGAAVLAHKAFVPGWGGDRAGAAERMLMARTYARRGPASGEFLAWLDAVEAECETRCKHLRTALNLIAHGEEVLTAGPEHALPEWMDWFSPVRLAAFKGNTQLIAGHLPQARETLLGVLDTLPADADKQRTVVLGDLAAVEAAAGAPEAACVYAIRALDQLETHWYATGMERVREARRALAAWQHEQCVRDLDDRLYGWGTTLSVLTR
ncbi:transcriptional regulator [Streptomyces sp. NBC_01408]|uniref:transcriptional regulator n=1 Tax=Streptomyces sp. NBC_01408 TaxID=2903855 RepID=UPI00225A402A|nr:transcriptional regulator [Streptomyces sp. NBC_01408]MCX4692631.1 transcriptional regulator [Streptomyces sp. NBC_01408]